MSYDDRQMWFVIWVAGSCRDGTRNAGCDEFGTEIAARERIEGIARTHPDATITLVRGTVEDSWS